MHSVLPVWCTFIEHLLCARYSQALGCKEGCSTVPAIVSGLVGQIGPQSVGAQGRRELSQGGPPGVGSGWESFSEEVTSKLGLEEKKIWVSFFQNLFWGALDRKGRVSLREMMRDRVVVGTWDTERGNWVAWILGFWDIHLVPILTLKPWFPKSGDPSFHAVLSNMILEMIRMLCFCVVQHGRLMWLFKFEVWLVLQKNWMFVFISV